ncbi:MAG: PAS domain-containing protein, partial [Candidatus Sumerlaeia bacterium]|nr:PAS domain-containing protein [Candidatus Sumerlaeia bacterium]
MKAEENLRQSEAKLRFLFEESQALNLLIAPNGTIQDINKIVTSLLGYDKTEVIGKSALDFVVPEQREMVASILAKAFSGEDTPALEVDVIARDGIKTLLFSEGQVLLVEKGEIKSVLFTAVDITEQKRAIDRLKSVHKIYQQAIENAGGVPYLYNYRTNEFDYISEACEKLLGIPAKDLTRDKFLQLIQENIITEPGAPSDPYKYRSAFGSQTVSHYKADVRILTPAGEEKWLSDFSVPIFDEQTGEVVASLGILLDITDRKRAEEELKQIHRIYRSAIENAQGVPYRFKYTDTTYEFIGEGCEEILGIHPRELTFQKFRELVKEIIVTDPEGPFEADEYCAAFRTGQLKHFRVDYKIVTPQGTEKWLSDCALPLRDERTGTVIGALGILQDIT